MICSSFRRLGVTLRIHITPSQLFTQQVLGADDAIAGFEVETNLGTIQLIHSEFCGSFVEFDAFSFQQLDLSLDFYRLGTRLARKATNRPVRLQNAMTRHGGGKRIVAQRIAHRSIASLYTNRLSQIFVGADMTRRNQLAKSIDLAREWREIFGAFLLRSLTLVTAQQARAVPVRCRALFAASSLFFDSRGNSAYTLSFGLGHSKGHRLEYCEKSERNVLAPKLCGT